MSVSSRSTALDHLDGVALVAPPDDSYIPAQAYVSDAIFDTEMREVLPSSWIFVGDIYDLAEPGDYLTTIIGYEPVVVVRGDDMELRAFSNVCPHRATTVADGAGNCGARLRCPYHGWSFHHDGTLAAAPFAGEFERPLDFDQLGLRPLRVGVWELFVFVNVSGDAPALSEWLEDADDMLRGHQLHTVPRILRIEQPVAANWKVCYENGMDTYHVQTVHAGSLCTIPTDKPTLHVGRTTASSVSRWANMPMPYVKETLEGQARQGPVIVNIFPGFIVSAQPSGSAAIYWWRPVALGRSVAGTASYSIHDDDPRLGEALVRQIQDEDVVICERVQTGLRSRYYQPGPRHTRELRVNGFQRWYIDALAAAAAG